LSTHLTNNFVMENRVAGGGGRGGDTQENAEPYIAHNTFEAPTRESVSRGVDLVKSMQVRPALFIIRTVLENLKIVCTYARYSGSSRLEESQRSMFGRVG
jgi:hypothetical protein